MSALVEEKLDWVVATHARHFLHANVEVSNVEMIFSNHNAIFLNLMDPKFGVFKHKFCLKNSWLKEEGCKEVIIGSWNSSIG